MHPLASETPGMQTILGGTGGHADDGQVLAMLCATLNPASVRLRIVHVIVVPSNVPLDISMPVVEKEAAHILEQGAPPRERDGEYTGRSFAISFSGSGACSTPA